MPDLATPPGRRNFDAFLQSKGVKSTPPKPVNTGKPCKYLVDNSLLETRKSAGVPYFYECVLDDESMMYEPSGFSTSSKYIALFDSIVTGTLMPGGAWVKVTEANHPSLQEKLVFNPNEERYLPVEMLGVTVLTTAIPNGKGPVGTELADEELDLEGQGTAYEVINRTAYIRAEPDTQASITSTLSQGHALEAFQWDATWKWRKVRSKTRRNITGWMMLDKDHTGPLIRPVDKSFYIGKWALEPMDPIYVAVAENRIEDLCKMLAPAGEENPPKKNVDVRAPNDYTPLMKAVEQGFWDAFVILMFYEADPDLVHTETGRVAVDFVQSQSKPAKALVRALCNKDFEAQHFDDAREQLLRPERRVMLDQAMDKVFEKEKRKNEEANRKESERRRKIQEESQRRQKERASKAEGAKKQALMYKVVVDEIEVHTEADADTEILAMHEQGDKIEIIETVSSEGGMWGKVAVKTEVGMEFGWLQLFSAEEGLFCQREKEKK